MATKGKNPPNIQGWIKMQPAKSRAKLTKLVKELKLLFRSPNQSSVLWCYDVGRCVSKLFPRKKRHYGASVAELLADELSPGRDREDKRLTNLFYQARDLADKYRDKRYVKSLARKTLANGKSLTLNHLKSLVSIDDEKQRDELLAECLADSWSVRQLRWEIQKLVGRKRSRGGRTAKPRKAPTAAMALHDIHVMTNQWLDNYEVWFAGKKAALSKVPKREQTGRLLENLEIAEEDLRRLKKATIDGLKTLRELKKTTKQAVGKGG